MTREFRGYGLGDEEDGEGEVPRRRAPGKVTLTSRLRPYLGDDADQDDTIGGVDHLLQPAQPVQRKAASPHDDPFWFGVKPRDGEASAETIHEHAATGVTGPGDPLPHLEPIQSSFGHHDVTGIQAHVGGPAAEASAAIGAVAYATGDQVAFASTPDLHTAAHESAHVIQQQGGVHLKGGVGEDGDAYERHADAVADKVVAGESAEALLDQLAGGQATATAPAVQHKKPADQRGSRASETAAIATDVESSFAVALDALALGIEARDYFEANAAMADALRLLPQIEELLQPRPARSADEQTAIGRLRQLRERFETLAPRAPRGGTPSEEERTEWVARTPAPLAPVAKQSTPRSPSAAASRPTSAVDRVRGTNGLPVRALDEGDRAHDEYLGRHWDQLRDTVEQHFTTHLEHWNAPRLLWAVDAGERGKEIAAAIFPTLHIAGQLESLVAPEALGPALELGMVTMPRPGEGDGDATWNVNVGTAVARLLERRLAQSMERMGARYVAAYDANGGAVNAVNLPRGDAMDGVAAALLSDRLVRVMGPLPAPDRGRAPRKPRQWRWLGARDPGLWNWIEVSDPPDARLEDVVLLLPPDVVPQVEGDGRFFRMPEDWARAQPGAGEHAPSSAAVATGLELASSTVALDAAIAQAADAPPQRPGAFQIEAAIDKIAFDLFQIAAMLGDAYADRVAPAYVALGAARDDGRGRRAELSRVLAGQQALLTEIRDELDLFKRLGYARGHRANAGPVQALFVEFALAAGNSHLYDVGRRHLAAARTLVAEVDRRLAEEALAANAGGAIALAATGGDGADAARARQRDRFDRLDSNAGAHDDISVEASIDAFLLHTQAVDQQLSDMTSALYATNDRLASIVGMPWVVAAEDLGEAVGVVRDKARNVHVWLREELAETSGGAARRALLERAQAALAEQISSTEIVDLSRRVVTMLQRIDDVQHVIQVVSMAIQTLAVSVVAAGAGMWVTAGAAPTTTLGKVGVAAAGTMTEAVVMGTLQTVLFGDNPGEALAENLLGSLLSIAVLRGFHKVTERYGPFTAENIARWEQLGSKADVMALRATHLTTELALGAGAGHAAMLIVRSPVKPTEDEALQAAMQGASIVASHWITRRMVDARGRLERARSSMPPEALPRLEKTLADIDALRGRAEAAAHTPVDSDVIGVFFADQHHVLAAEATLRGVAGDQGNDGDTSEPRPRSRPNSADHADTRAPDDSAAARLEREVAGGAAETGDGLAAHSRRRDDSLVRDTGDVPVPTGSRLGAAPTARDVAEHTPTGSRIDSAADLARIRHGAPGRIRGEAELSNADVTRSLNAQLQAISPEQVDTVLGSFPPDQQAAARVVLARASGFGNLESLNPLRVALTPHLDAGRELYTPGSGSLADNIVYSASKGSFAGVPGAGGGRIPVTSELRPRTIVILDDVVLHRIRTDPAFAESLVDNSCILLEPRGFNAGINMYNSGSEQLIADRTTKLLARAQEIHRAGKVGFEAAVDVALHEGTAQTLATAHPELLSQIRVVEAADHADVSSAAISRQLTGDAGINERELGETLDRAQLTPEAQDYARELLAQQGEVFSARRFANELAAHHQHVIVQAAQRGVSPDAVYFYIPESGKSYGMIAMAHRQATGTQVDRYINGPADLSSRTLAENTAIVIFDDVAGSGDSLAGAVAGVERSGYRGQVIVAPMVSTETARDLFENPDVGIASGRDNVSFEPRRMSQTLADSPFFQQLDADQREALHTVIQSPGYGGNALSMSFPYMAPDNNNRFFGDLIAKFFIVNRNRKASKASTYQPTPL